MTVTPLKAISYPKPSPRVREFNADWQKKRIASLRKALLTASVNYILQGAAGVWQDRLREASELSGIPRNLIEIAVKSERKIGRGA